MVGVSVSVLFGGNGDGDGSALRRILIFHSCGFVDLFAAYIL